jgi:uncharacterized membrane protein
VTVLLPTSASGVGLPYNSVLIIIGAIVFAPLLGPNVALSLGMALVDPSLLRPRAEGAGQDCDEDEVVTDHLASCCTSIQYRPK